MDQVPRRIEAISRRLHGESVVSICRSLAVSRRWFYYWLSRYTPGEPTWAQDRSRAPHHQRRKLAAGLEQLVCQVRRRLLKRKYAQRGAVAIQWELRQLGAEPLPETWTINRIIRRHHLRPEDKLPRPARPAYPALEAKTPGLVQQLDLVGPRYLSGGVRFYGFHLIDAASNAVALEIVLSKQEECLCQALLQAWRRLGLPRLRQLDNELSFRGSNRYPRSFGLLIRLCLALGVEVRFIPEGEPWRNGIVEHFNDTYDKSFLRSQYFRSLGHLQRELGRFERFHNEHHRYAKLGQRPPNAVHKANPRRALPEHLALAWVPKSWKDGKVSFTRLTDARGSVRFFTERFLVDPLLVHEYVVGTISIKDNRLRFYHQHRCVKDTNYKVSKQQLLSHM